MRKEVERQVGDCAYLIKQMDTETSLDMLERIAKLIGSPLSVFFALGQDDSNELSTREEAEIIGKVISEMMANMGDKKFSGILKDLCKKDLLKVITEEASVPVPVNFNEHFAGDQLKDLFTLTKEILEVNYSNFLEDILAIFAAAKGRKKSTSLAAS